MEVFIFPDAVSTKMENLKEMSVGLAAICSLIAIVGSLLLLARKLKPTGRRYRDRPELWVFVGFWTYVIVHWGLPYGYWTVTWLPDEGPEVSFSPIEKAAKSMASNSIRQLEALDNFEIEVIINIDGKQAGNGIMAKIGLAEFEAAVVNLKEKILDTTGLANQFIDFLQSGSLDQCFSELSADTFTNAIANFSNIAETIQSTLDDTAPKVATITKALIEDFKYAAVSKEIKGKLTKVLVQRKDLLKMFLRDMEGMEGNRRELIEEMQPKLVNKIELIREMLYAQIFLPLFISFGVYVGFSRLEVWMSVRWPARICAFTVPLAGLNILIYSAFIVRLAMFTCPPEVDNIGLERFVSKWKPPMSDLPATKICGSKSHTLFAGLAIDDGFSMNVEQIQKEMETTIARSGVDIEYLKFDQNFSNELIGIQQLSTQLKQFEECSGAQENSVLSQLILMLENLLEDGENIGRRMTNWNKHVLNGTSILKPFSELLYQETQKSIESSMRSFETKVQMADLPCETIEGKIKQCRQLICQQLDIQLDEFWIVIDLVLIALLVLFCLNLVVYRTIALWELEFHHPAPPPQPQPPVRVLRRYRARRLDANLF